METPMPADSPPAVPGADGRCAPHPISVQPPAKVAWRHFAGRLSEAIGALEEDEYLIVLVKRSNHFVQFAAQGACGMRAEAVSNYYLPEPDSLSEAQHAALLALGWRAPTNLPEGLAASWHRPDGSSNYFLDLAPPVNHAALALLAVATFVQVLDAAHPGELEYQAFSEDGASIRFPSLAIRRASG